MANGTLARHAVTIRNPGNSIRNLFNAFVAAASYLCKRNKDKIRTEYENDFIIRACRRRPVPDRLRTKQGETAYEL